MSKKRRVLVGKIGVDAGLVWIGDPCYILHKDKLPKSLGKDWGEFCDALHGNDNVLKSFPYDMGHEGLGVCVSSGYGDGEYPVYAEIRDEGDGWGERVRVVTVRFG